MSSRFMDNEDGGSMDEQECPDCICADILENDKLRHFRECPERKPLPCDHVQSDISEHFYVKDTSGNELHCRMCGGDCRHPVVVQARERERAECVAELKAVAKSKRDRDRKDPGGAWFEDAARLLEHTG